MIYMPMKHVRPGMTLARDVSSGVGMLPLVGSGIELSESILRNLSERGIPGLYIESRICGDVEVEEFLNPELKQKTMGELKTLFHTYVNQSAISNASIKSVVKVAEELIMYILSKDTFLVNLMDIKDYDNYTYSHSMYVGMLSVLTGIHKGCTRSVLIELAMAGLLHDIGKLDIPPEIVNKPGALTPEEYHQMQNHPSLAIKRLKPTGLFSIPVLRGIGSHHEKYNGTGYPDGLTGKGIPVYGRILALSDVYDALTSARPYRGAWSSSEALEYMMGSADSQFDYDLLEVFLKTVAAYPVGTIVTLSNGDMAVVVRNSLENTLRPVVRLLPTEEHPEVEADLSRDKNYLHITIIGTINDQSTLPAALICP